MFQSLLSLLLASTLSLGSFGSAEMPQLFDDSSLLSVSPVPTKQAEFVEVAPLSGASVLAIDLASKSILYEKQSTLRVPIASLTKLMTAYLILNENDPDSLVTVGQNLGPKEGSRMGLYPGEQISVKNLLHGLLIESGNDAALALAEFSSGSESAFVEKMNSAAKELGLKNTVFENTTGLDSAGAYSTTKDLSVLTAYLLKDQSFRDIVKKPSAEVTSVTGDVHKLVSTNVLLGKMGISGVKTGKTLAAGECLIVLAKTPEGHEVLTIVLGSEDRFLDTQTLLDWIYRTYVW